MRADLLAHDGAKATRPTQNKLDKRSLSVPFFNKVAIKGDLCMFRTRFNAAAIALLAIGTLAQPGQAQDAPSPRLKLVDGRTNPELLPEAFAWRLALWALVDASRADETLSPDEAIEGLGRYTLFVSADDARTIIQAASAALDRVDRLRKALEDDTIPWSVAAQKARDHQADEVILECRAALERQLSSQAYRGLERYVATAKRGMTHFPSE